MVCTLVGPAYLEGLHDFVPVSFCKEKMLNVLEVKPPSETEDNGEFTSS